MDLPYQIPPEYSEKIPQLTRHLEALKMLNGQFLDFYFEGKHFKISSIRNLDPNKGITVGIWEIQGDRYIAAARAQAGEFSFTKQKAIMDMSFEYEPELLHDETLEFYGLEELEDVDPGYAFGVDKNYRRIGLSQFIFTILLYCLKSIGIDELDIFRDKTISPRKMNFVSNESGDLNAINPGSLYTRYSPLINVDDLNLDESGKWMHYSLKFTHMTIPTTITSIQQQLITHILSNEA